MSLHKERKLREVNKAYVKTYLKRVRAVFNECRKTKTKVITLANQKGHR